MDNVLAHRTYAAQQGIGVLHLWQMPDYARHGYEWTATWTCTCSFQFTDRGRL